MKMRNQKKKIVWIFTLYKMWVVVEWNVDMEYKISSIICVCIYVCMFGSLFHKLVWNFKFVIFEQKKNIWKARHCNFIKVFSMKNIWNKWCVRHGVRFTHRWTLYIFAMLGCDYFRTYLIVWMFVKTRYLHSKKWSYCKIAHPL